MSKITTSVENGYMIFKKKQESADEILFYNTDYFRRIGFPDAEVSIGKLSPDGKMVGGYYKNTAELTYPFRQFVYLIQREKSKEVGTSSIFSTTKTESSENPDFFERLSGYGVEIYKGVKSGIDQIGPFFKKKPEDMTEDEKKQEFENELEKKAEEEMEQKTEETREEEIEQKEHQDFNKENYWIVKIEVIGKPSESPSEVNEAKWRQTLKESKVDRSIGKSKVGPMYEVGGRFVGMCESVKDWSPPSPEISSPLPGSLVDKWSKLIPSTSTNESSSSLFSTETPQQTTAVESTPQLPPSQK